jgi:hypothetical protein
MLDVLPASDIQQCTGWWITVSEFLAHSVGQVPVSDIQQVHTDCHLAVLLFHYNLINILIGDGIEGMLTERNLKCSGAMSHLVTCFSYYFCFIKNLIWPWDWQNCIKKPSHDRVQQGTVIARRCPRPSDWNLSSHQHWGQISESHGILAVTNRWKFEQHMKLFLCMSLRHMEEEMYSSTHS